jgi:hypothetical protein
MKLSDQAMGAIMGALQKCILEQSDIVPTLKGFDFETTEDDVLVITNPPAFSMSADGTEAN